MTQLPNKRFRGTGLYRNHSRRRGDKEYRIKSLLQAAERESLQAKTGDKDAALRAFTLYEDALNLLNNVASEEHTTLDIVHLQEIVHERMIAMQRLIQS